MEQQNVHRAEKKSSQLGNAVRIADLKFHRPVYALHAEKHYQATVKSDSARHAERQSIEYWGGLE